ncbi:MAG TPA: iron-containing alcohol dehydrogenase [Sporosarcina psychrophila]|uniref:Iron-containing alcohol dehydrogenase n=1 Tax=Sporosarcina psychrophila TaxID=1476 RepID=A0A921FZ43_SPOPS|nr:iron-containing alcohol dehydrogenase [Sporosarcina psychrophila]
MSEFNNMEFMAKTTLYTGSGSLKFLKGAIAKYGWEGNVLFVTDKGIEGAGILKKVIDSLPDIQEKSITYNDVKPNPSVTATNAIYEKHKDDGIQNIIAVGGGSVIDTAKALAVLFTNGGSIDDYFGFDLYSNEPLPVFAVATTVGTGSEGGHATVITVDNSDLKTKQLVFGEGLFPKAAILDGELLLGMPGSLVSSTGMDALTHAIEGYVSRNGSIVTDALNLHAVRVIGEAILEASSDTTNISAMNRMIQASTTTGIGMSNGGLGLVHGISHAIGAQYDAPHGIVNAILLPYVLEYNWIANPKKFADIAQALRVNTWGISVEDAAKAGVKRVKELTNEVGIPSNLSEIGVSEDSIEILTDIAFNDELYMGANPRRATRKDIKDILTKAIGSNHSNKQLNSDKEKVAVGSAN